MMAPSANAQELAWSGNPSCKKRQSKKQLFGGNALCPKRQSAGSINWRQIAVLPYAKRSH
jgi:hypothetical protein